MDKKSKLLRSIDLRKKEISNLKGRWKVHLIHPALAIAFTSSVYMNGGMVNMYDAVKACIPVIASSLIMFALLLNNNADRIIQGILELEKVESYIRKRTEEQLTKGFKNPIIVGSADTYLLPGDKDYRWYYDVLYKNNSVNEHFNNEYEVIKAGYHRLNMV